MTVREVMFLCGGYDYNYTFAPRERIGYFYPTTSLKWCNVRSYLEKNPHILDREVAHITALGSNSFKIYYYITAEDKQRIEEERHGTHDKQEKGC